MDWSSTMEGLTVAMFVSILMSVALEWLPKLRDWWEALPSQKKQHVIALLVFLTSVGVTYGQCYFRNVCVEDFDSFLTQAFITFVLALAGQQGFHSVLKRNVVPPSS